MSEEELMVLIREYSLPKGWYSRVLGLQERANYGTKFETRIYEEQVKSGYRLPLHPFTLIFFKHYCLASGKLVPNGWRKLIGLIYLVETSEYGKIIPHKPILAAVYSNLILQMYAFRGIDVIMLRNAREVAAQEKMDDVKDVEMTTLRAEELSKRETDHLARIEALEIRLERARKKIYEMGFLKAKDMFADRFPDIPLDDFVMPVVVSPFGETALPSEAGDATASHPPKDGPSGIAPEP
ncbi:hypothetical protein RJ639_002698 [Escallonia herrerae]|uniref:Transposase (putative) gypsy type domain-containing protein n=1 Tax=Escallonia herrerae TaxID=1293975 RepID=A0AA89BTM4_9ASTE|nr:hypothetical protein RJ639_002698 [Escallonia herrerae]